MSQDGRSLAHHTNSGLRVCAGRHESVLELPRFTSLGGEAGSDPSRPKPSMARYHGSSNSPQASGVKTGRVKRSNRCDSWEPSLPAMIRATFHHPLPRLAHRRTCEQRHDPQREKFRADVAAGKARPLNRQSVWHCDCRHTLPIALEPKPSGVNDQSEAEFSVHIDSRPLRNHRRQMPFGERFLRSVQHSGYE
jgi:hypothetical protein